MEKHHILLKDQLIEYELTYKDIKSIYLKVEKGILIIHAPFFTPLSFINKNIIKYQNRLLSQINQKYQIILRDLNEKNVKFMESVYMFIIIIFIKSLNHF